MLCSPSGLSSPARPERSDSAVPPPDIRGAAAPGFTGAVVGGPKCGPIGNCIGTCRDCGNSTADPTHARAEWATMVASSRPGLSPFWRMAIAADAFFHADPGQGTPDPASPITKGMSVARLAFAAAGSLSDRVGTQEMALRLPDEPAAARAGMARAVAGVMASERTFVDPIESAQDVASWLPAVEVGARVELLDRGFASLMGGRCVPSSSPLLEMSSTGACCAVTALAIWMSGGKNITRISVVVEMEWRAAPAGVLAPCALRWREKTNCTYPLPGMPGNEVPGDGSWHQIYPGTNVKSGTFSAWEGGQARGKERASKAAASGGLPFGQRTTINDPALWDADLAAKQCGRRTRYLTIGVSAMSGCHRTGRAFYAEATTEGYADSTTSPEEPTKTEGRAVV